jgi:hypothetical protein
MFAHPQFSLATMQVPKVFSQVITIPHGQSHQKRPQSRFFNLYDLPTYPSTL